MSILPKIIILALAHTFLSAEAPPKIEAPAAAPAPAKAHAWEKEISRFEEQDKANPPAKNGVLFVGSSSIVFWDTAKAYPDLKPLNRGFGGSQLEDSNYFADRIIIPYHPKVIVVYAGDNDLKGNRSPQQVFQSFTEMHGKIRAALPEARLIFISIKPSPSRWTLWPKAQEANKMIAEAIAKDKLSAFCDVSPVMLDEKGEPKKEIFKPDMLHMNSDGYALWQKVLQPYLDKALAAETK